jgi:hypothetical protein
MLSGIPGRWTASGVTVPARGPVSQYFDSRRARVSANTSADPSAVTVNPFVKYRPPSTVVTVPSGSSRNRLPVPRASRMAARKCSKWKSLVDSVK